MTMTNAVGSLSLQTAVVAGAGANANIAVTGIAVEDTLIAVQESAVTTADPTDRTAASSITSAGNIQCTAATTSDTLIVLFHDASGPGIDSPCIKAFLGTGNDADTNITVTGIALEDTLLGVYELTSLDAVWTDRTATSSITAANTIQSTEAFTNTTSDQCLTIYHDASGRGINSASLKWGQCNGSATTSTLTGISTEDTLLLVLELAVTSNIATDRTATTTITAANTLTSGTSTVNDKLLVLYHDASA